MEVTIGLTMASNLYAEQKERIVDLEKEELIGNIGFVNLDLTKYFSFNKPAINCYKKIGFKEVGRIREAKQIAGERYDIIIMDIINP